MVATRMSPYGLVRPFVGQDVPGWLDEVCVAAARGILELGTPGSADFRPGPFFNARTPR